MELGLVAGHDYPDTYREFVEMFPDNTACEVYLMRMRGRKGSFARPARHALPSGMKAEVALHVPPADIKRL